MIVDLGLTLFTLAGLLATTVVIAIDARGRSLRHRG